MKLKGEMHIGRPLNADYVTIDVTDKKSRCRAVEIKLSRIAMGDAILGNGFVECEIHVNDSGVLGKTYEHKQEKVTVEQGASDDFILAAVQELEVDGWEARTEDLKNFHRREYNPGTITYTVTYTRYVED